MVKESISNKSTNAGSLKLLSKLHPLERKVLPHLIQGITFDKLIELSGLKDIEVMRSIQWLSNKNLVTIKETKEDYISLDKNGINYSKNGLPELSFLKAVKENSLKNPEGITREEILSKTNITEQEFGISVGVLKKKVAIQVDNGPKGMLIKPTAQTDKLLSKESFEELFLKKLANCNSVLLNSLEPEEKFAFDNLLSRKEIVKKETKKTIFVEITELGKEIKKLSSENTSDTIDRLSHEMLVKGNWKNKQFRSYDIEINVPKIYGGKRHFVRQSMEYIKQIWLELGFKEMTGSFVQSAFWDLDVLFVPQDHPARTMQDTFYIKDPENSKLPKELKEKVKEVHENGGKTGSKGWGNKWEEGEASKNMLRTHTTVLSAQTIANLKESDLPAKFFSVNKVFRNEALNWKHLFEFHQVEGIVIDPNANLKHLKGYLREFYQKLGFEKVRMRPGHFPYTEPSLEVDVFHPEKKEWIELGGAGIFRPEVVQTLFGIDIPVLAWGQGLERGIMSFYQFKDIRQLYNNDIKEIKSVKIWR
jgi:phenylalanyl-tRNA synthetase alpha chain